MSRALLVLPLLLCLRVALASNPDRPGGGNKRAMPVLPSLVGTVPALPPQQCAEEGTPRFLKSLPDLKMLLRRTWYLCSGDGVLDRKQVGIELSKDQKVYALRLGESRVLRHAKGINGAGRYSIDPNSSQDWNQVNFRHLSGGEELCHAAFTEDPLTMTLECSGFPNYQPRYVAAQDTVGEPEAEPAAVLSSPPAPIQKLTRYPAEQLPVGSAECKASGGTWSDARTDLAKGKAAAMSGQPLQNKDGNPGHGCVRPTSDTGKACVRQSDCEGTCLTDMDVPTGTKVTGRCSPWRPQRTTGQCLNEVAEGEASGGFCLL